MPDAGMRGSVRHSPRGWAATSLLSLIGLLVALAAACGVPISADETLPPPPEVSDAGRSVESRQVSVLAIDATPTAAPLAAAVAAEPRSPQTDASAGISNVDSQAAPSVDEVDAIEVEATVDAPPEEPAAVEPTQTEVGEPAATETPATETPEAPPEITAGGGEDRVIEIVNEQRASLGLTALQADAELMASASAYAQLMAESRWFYCGCDFHTGPDGSTPSSRVAASGYTGRYWGEALAGGQGSAASAVNGWLASPAHAAILLDGSATDIGVGHYYNPADGFGHYWTLVTGIR